MSTQRSRSDPDVIMGRPVTEGTRITVEPIREELGAGQTIEQLLEAHPRLTREGVLAEGRFGADVLRPTSPICAPAATTGVPLLRLEGLSGAMNYRWVS